MTVVAKAEDPNKATAKNEDADSDADFGDDDEDDTMDDAAWEAQLAACARRTSRQAISAENTSLRDASWVAPDYDKTAEQEARLWAALKKSFMFATLAPQDLAAVIKAFKESAASAGTKVIKQGDDVMPTDQALFVLEEGELDVFRDGVTEAVASYQNPGQYFGDLAVLYNAPRAATVVSKTDCKLWSIDRNTFNYLVKNAARKASEKHVAFLATVEILKDVSQEDLSKLQETLMIRVVQAGEVIIKQGEEGNDFFFIETGKCEARVNANVVREYGPQEYFGELALLNDAVRAASVVAIEPTQLMVLGRQAFKRLLGPAVIAKMQAKATA